ncbi:MAG: hypothetical protein QXG39_01155 [Candidatus Aenigmatarchaeota archaeon]
MKSQIDEFALVLLAGLILVGILVVVWTSQASQQLTVNPKSKHLVVARGSSSYFFIFLNGSAENVSLRSSGEVANWISFERNMLNVKDFEKVKVLVTVPTTASYGVHWGEIYVEALGFKEIIPISINVSTRTEREKISFSFGDFKVGYIVGEEVIMEKENIKVEKGYFHENSPNFAVLIPEEKLPLISSAYLQVEIEKTNSLGSLIIEFNDEKIFEKKVGVGEVVIPIKKELINKSNSIVLKTVQPGLIFWSNSFYRIKALKFILEYNGTIFKDFEFFLEDFEVLNFKEGLVSMVTKVYDLGLPRREAKLIIEINGNKIFEDVPPYFLMKKFGEEVDIKAGKNVISFSTSIGGSYSLEEVVLTIFQY